MTFGAEFWAPALISAAGSTLSSWLSGKSSKKKESKLQKTQSQLVDQLLASLTGQGQFSDLYNVDEEAFQKSFVDPAKSMFKNQIAPQIQQQYIASGQQRGTGLEDQLLRAGVDLDSMLNSYLYQAQQDAMNRKQGSINSILGSQGGYQPPTTGTQDALAGLSGYFGSEGFGNTVKDVFKEYLPQKSSQSQPARRGFETDFMDWGLGDKRWGGGY